MEHRKIGAETPVNIITGLLSARKYGKNKHSRINIAGEVIKKRLLSREVSF